MKRVMLLMMIVLVISCKKDEPSANPDQELIEQYILDNSIVATEVNGIYQYEITGNPTGNDQGDVFSIYYELLNLETGDLIDSHQMSDGDPIKLLQGGSTIFPIGLDRGLAGIKEGETYGIIIPSALAFRGYSINAFDPSSVLLFEVEVVQRQTLAEISTEEDQAINDYITANDLNNTMTNPVDPVVSLSDGVYYKKTGNGDGNAVAIGDSVTVDYDGKYLDESSFDALSDFKYQFGVGTVISGFDLGVSEMEQSETATIFIPSDQAYGASVRVIPFTTADDLQNQFAIPAYATRIEPFKVLIFDISLKTIH